MPAWWQLAAAAAHEQQAAPPLPLPIPICGADSPLPLCLCACKPQTPVFAIVVCCSDLTPAAAVDAIGRLERAGQLINLHGTVLLRPGEVAEALNLVGCLQQPVCNACT